MSVSKLIFSDGSWYKIFQTSIRDFEKMRYDKISQSTVPSYKSFSSSPFSSEDLIKSNIWSNFNKLLGSTSNQIIAFFGLPSQSRWIGISSSPQNLHSSVFHCLLTQGQECPVRSPVGGCSWFILWSKSILT